MRKDTSVWYKKEKEEQRERRGGERERDKKTERQQVTTIANLNHSNQLLRVYPSCINIPSRNNFAVSDMDSMFLFQRFRTYHKT